MTHSTRSSQCDDLLCYGQGTRLFQSAGVLSGSLESSPPAIDHLDDLESIFYVLLFLTLMYNQHGESNNLRKGNVGFDLLRDFAHAEVRRSFNAKLGFLSSRATLREMSAALHNNWNGVVYNLLDALRQIFKGVLENKTAILDITSDKPAGPGFRFAELIAQRDQHYGHILKLFDDAIEALPISANAPAPMKFATPVPVATSPPSPPISPTPAKSAATFAIGYTNQSCTPLGILPPNVLNRHHSRHDLEQLGIKHESPDNLGKRGSECEPKTVRRSKRLRTVSGSALITRSEGGDGMVGRLRSRVSLAASRMTR